MLTSLLVNNRDVKIYVLTEGLRSENEKIIREEVEDKGGYLEFIFVDSSIVDKFPMPTNPGLSHISRATYYRLLISEFLPKKVHKAIYLDCDIIVNKNINELWNTNLEGYAIAACKQIGSGFEAVRLGYPIEYGYFNAGMNVINLDYLRENNICSIFIQYIADNYGKIKFHDQDTLNATLYDKALSLPPQWNMTSAVYVFQLDKRGDSENGRVINAYAEEKSNAKKYLKDPYILHYVSRPKPWQDNCVHPLYHLYYDYAKRTIHFCNIKPQNELIRQTAILRKFLINILSAIKQSIVHTDKTRI